MQNKIDWYLLTPTELKHDEQGRAFENKNGKFNLKPNSKKVMASFGILVFVTVLLYFLLGDSITYLIENPKDIFHPSNLLTLGFPLLFFIFPLLEIVYKLFPRLTLQDKTLFIQNKPFSKKEGFKKQDILALQFIAVKSTRTRKRNNTSSNSRQSSTYNENYIHHEINIILKNHDRQPLIMSSQNDARNIAESISKTLNIPLIEKDERKPDEQQVEHYTSILKKINPRISEDELRAELNSYKIKN